MQNELGTSATIVFDIFNTLSKQFSSIWEKLANQMEKTSFPSSNLQTSFFYVPLAHKKCKKYQVIWVQKSSTYKWHTDQILKLAGTTISKFLSDLFNTPILESDYPDVVKIAQIIPIHKLGSKECCWNYWLIPTTYHLHLIICLKNFFGL